MNNARQTKEQLLQTIEELQMLNRQLLAEREQEIVLNFSWAGNLGHWYWNMKTNSVTFNPLKVTTLGYKKEEIPKKVPFQYFTDKLHPDDYQKTMDAMLAHLEGRAKVYEVEYRIRTKDGDYKWYYDRGRITQYDADGKPVFLAGIVFDITQERNLKLDLELKNKLLSEQSLTDGLTKVKNHRALIEHLNEELSAAMMKKTPLAVALFDIDDFKKVNDSKGHLCGDSVLIEIADILQRSVRQSDMVGRYGGEEFMIIFSKTDGNDAYMVSERIRKTIEQNCFEEGIRVTISGGIKEYAGESLTEMIEGADANLYKAKGAGKNKIVI